MFILVASENETALTTLVGFLRSHTSYEIAAARSLVEVENIATNTLLVDVLITDLSWPQADGVAVALGLQQKFPNLQTAFLNTQSHRTQLPDGTFIFPNTAQNYQEIGNWVSSLSLRRASPTSSLAETASPVGQYFGDYYLIEKRRDTTLTETFRALQQSMDREVVLERLRPEYAADKNSVREFRALVRARAMVNHPAIAAVYEAQEIENQIYYTRELVKGMSLAQYAQGSRKLSQETVLRMLKVAAEALTYLDHRQTLRREFMPEDVFLGEDGVPRISNLALGSAGRPWDTGTEIRRLVAFADQAAGPDVLRKPELRTLIAHTKPASAPQIITYPALAQAAEQALQRIAAQTNQPGSVSARGSRGRKKFPAWQIVAGVAGCVLVGALLLSLNGPKKQPVKKTLTQTEMVRIPAGAFIFQKESVSLPEFWIDEHEVTIGLYAAFLKAVGNGATPFDHADQPKQKKSHVPNNWEQYYPAAQAGGTYAGRTITLNCPVIYVDWWDAYAYAKWKGRRLPTEQEWEKAASGTSGFAYPWGNEWVAGRSNVLAGEADANAASWMEVDSVVEDASPFKVEGMGGNVAEWTATWSQHPTLPDIQVPVFRGGYFSQKESPLREQRWQAKNPEYAQPYIGFRTVSDQQP